jgi:uncharacterized PurR-regulated membrane protein YhhQ (DUF165 family)
MTPKLGATITAYIAAITAANLLVAHYGPAVSVVNAFLLIGVDLALRDIIDDELGARRWPMLAMILTAGAISYAANPASARIAAASCAAFVAASTIDWTVYRALRGRASWADRANTSNVAGAAIDSALFPLLAFGYPPLWIVMIGQFAAKIGGGALFVLAIDAARRRRTGTPNVDEQIGVLAATYAQMGGRATPNTEDVTRARESYAAHRIAYGKR